MILKTPDMHLNLQAEQTELLPDESITPMYVMKWLVPIEELHTVSDKFFGRKLQHHIRQIKDKHRPLGLKIGNKLSAVIVDIDSYEELLCFKKKYEQFLDQIKKIDGDFSTF